MKHAVIFTKEADFRIWFEQNPKSVGVKKIILSQEVCPDYVVEMNDGRIATIEAELFAINFRYHGHSPSKVDYILACYSKTEEIDGVPVIAINKLWVWDADCIDSHAVPDSPLTDTELDILAALDSGGIAVTALADGSFAGNQEIWMRFPPDRISALPRGADDSILTVMPPEAKKFIKKYHHALIGAGLSRGAAESIESLCRRRLVGYRPLAFLAALMDGGVLIDHPAWIPTELYAKPEARERYGDQITERLFRQM